MSTLLDERPKTTDSGDDNLHHWVCSDCDPDGEHSLCGLDVSDRVWVPDDVQSDDSQLCIVCDDIQVCPRCGTWF